jgi:hypothetical protein
MILPTPSSSDNATYAAEVAATRRFIETTLRLAENIKAAVAAFTLHLEGGDHPLDEAVEELTAAAREAVWTAELWLDGEPDDV